MQRLPKLAFAVMLGLGGLAGCTPTHADRLVTAEADRLLPGPCQTTSRFGTREYVSAFEYDDDGRVIVANHVTPRGHRREVTTYRPDGKRDHVLIDAEGAQTGRWYVYEGDLLVAIEHDRTGTHDVVRGDRRTYDASGHLIQIENFKVVGQDEVLVRGKRFRRLGGRLAQEVAFDRMRRPKFVTDIDVDAYERVIARRTRRPDGELVETQTYTYLGGRLHETVTDGPRPGRHVMTYDEHGNALQGRSYDGEGALIGEQRNDFSCW